jgi:uncharacterized protein YcbX
VTAEAAAYDLAVLTVTGLFVYPIKACGGVAVEQAKVGRYGLEGDRQWMVVDAQMQGLTQRTHPALARVRPRPTGDGGLVLESEGRTAVAVNARLVAETTVEVWGQPVRAADAGDEAADWLTDFLGESVRLAGVADGYERPVNPRRDKRGRQVSFADSYPLLLCSESSLAELNRLASEPVPMDRFRPNLVISGDAGPWAEDSWTAIQVGDGARFDVVKGCDRCAVPQVDQRTGERHREPARVLAAHRRGADGKTYFGQNLVHVDIGATLAVGDAVGTVAG